MKKSPLQQLSVVIPMYNEGENVEPLLLEIYQALKNHPQFEMIVVDDGSTDSTVSQIKVLQTKMPQLRLLQHKKNAGQSVGIVTGVKGANFDWICTLDGDGQNDPADILKMAEEASRYCENTEILLMAGHRMHRKDTGWKRFGSCFANSIRRFFLKDNCPDTGCGLKLFSRTAFLQIPHFNHVHRYLPALFLRAGGEVYNVPVNHRPRTHGESKYGNWGRLKVGIVDLMGVAWLIRRPCQCDVKEVKS